MKLAKVSHPSLNKYQALDAYTNIKIKPYVENKEEKKRQQRYESIYASDVVKSFVSLNMSTLIKIFDQFKNYNIIHHQKMSVQGFINLFTYYQFIPSHISSPIVAKLFRSVPTLLLFNDFLNFDQFLEACIYVALTIYEAQQFVSLSLNTAECLQAFIDYLKPKLDSNLSIPFKKITENSKEKKSKFVNIN